MLLPKRTKYRKAHKGRIHGNAKGGTMLNFGAYGLKALQPERITARQIEAVSEKTGSGSSFALAASPSMFKRGLVFVRAPTFSKNRS